MGILFTLVKESGLCPECNKITVTKLLNKKVNCVDKEVKAWKCLKCGHIWETKLKLNKVV